MLFFTIALRLSLFLCDFRRLRIVFGFLRFCRPRSRRAILVLSSPLAVSNRFSSGSLVGFRAPDLSRPRFSAFFFFFFSHSPIMQLPQTLNIRCGKKLSGKSKDEILKEVLIVFQHYHVKCVQIAYGVIRLTFGCSACGAPFWVGVRLLPSYTFLITLMRRKTSTLKTSSEISAPSKGSKSRPTSNPDIFTGTRLVSVALDATPPGSLP